jgi:membrane associated rhomboid family serine protease
MKHVVRNFFSSLPWGIRVFVIIFVLGFPMAWVLMRTRVFDLYGCLDLTPALVWKGQVWRVITYAFLPAGPLDWAVSLFWLSTLVAVVGKMWNSTQFWLYCFLGALAGALPIVLFLKSSEIGWVGGAAMIFALLVAWDWFYRYERLILLGIGEISTRQAAVLVAVINSLILFFCVGWFIMVSMWCGGLAGWLYLTLRSKLVLGKTAQQIRSERVARLEL